MKAWAAGLLALLQTRSFVFCDLYTFTLDSGTVLRYTTGVVDVLYAGNTYSSKWIFIDDPSSKASAHWKAGLDVDTWTIAMMPAPTDPVTGAAYPATIYGQPWLAAVASGVLSGALVQVDRAYWAAWPTAGSPTFAPTYVGDKVFLGRVAAIDVLRSKAIITVNSYLELLTTLLPRNLFQAPCRHTLFDSGCTLVQATFASVGCNVIAVDATNSQFSANIAGGAMSGSGTCRLGQIVWTTGANAGLRRGVRDYAALGGGVGAFNLITPMPWRIQAADAFTAYPGCDKTAAACALFANSVNFGTTGATVPVPETAI